MWKEQARGEDVRKHRPFTGQRKSKNYEAEFNLARDSLIRSNQVVIEKNAIICSQKMAIAELNTTICEHLKTIKQQQEVIDGGK